MCVRRTMSRHHGFLLCALPGLSTVALAFSGETPPVYLTQWGSYGSGDGQFNYPGGVAIDAAGNVYVADRYNYRVQKFTSDGTYLTQWGTFGSGNGQFHEADDVATDAFGHVYVADANSRRIQKFTSDGAYLTQWSSAVGAADVATDAAGNVYVSGAFGVEKYTSTGTLLTQWGSGGFGNGEFQYADGVGTDSAGNVYVADTYNDRIQKFTGDGTYLTQWGTSGSSNGQFDRPYSVAVDLSGTVYVADLDNHRIQAFTSDGTYLMQWGSLGSGNGQFQYPGEVAVDAAGNIFVGVKGSSEFLTAAKAVFEAGVNGICARSAERCCPRSSAIERVQRLSDWRQGRFTAPPPTRRGGTRARSAGRGRARCPTAASPGARALEAGTALEPAQRSSARPEPLPCPGRSSTMRFSFVLALVPLLASPRNHALDGDEKVRPGQSIPVFEFKSVLGGDGRTKVSEFRGQPVLIAECSTDAAGLEAARVALGLRGELDKSALDLGLVVFLMETRNNDAIYVRALQMNGVPGADCRLLLTQDLPVEYDTSGPPPRLVLVGVDGTLLFAASYKRADELKKLLKEELAKMEKGWGKDPVLKKARALAWGDGKFGDARALLADVLMKRPVGDANPEFGVLGLELAARFTALEHAVGHYLEEGEPGRVLTTAGNLTHAAGKEPEWAGRATAAIALTAQAAREIQLEAELDALLKPTLKSAPQKGLDEKLHAFASGAASGTKVGARAARLADAVTRAVAGL